jgi:uncharacterized protein (TIGR00661 family)
MRILYGIQGTGNGHITRARTMSRALSEAGIKVDYVVSGRKPDLLFNMEPFGRFKCLRGMTMVQTFGKVDYLKTILTNNIFELSREITQLDVNPYDLVITDFEPVTAWAAKKAKKKVLGISHQYSFKYPIPTAGTNIVSHLVMKYFAPASKTLGFHWDHFGYPILPPLVEPMAYPVVHNDYEIIVYLPFEDIDQVTVWLLKAPDHEFIFYCQVDDVIKKSNVTLKPLSRPDFQKDLASSGGVICNAGFGLMSESIQAGKKLLVKPVAGQMEQLSNAVAARKLALADTVRNGFEARVLKNWLIKSNKPPRPYPDVAKGIVNWILQGMEQTELELAKSIWSLY